VRQALQNNKTIVLLAGALLALWTTSCSGRRDIEPPFLPSDNIKVNKLLDLQEEPEGLQDTGYEFVVWKLDAATSTVATATSNSLVRTNLDWQEGESDQLKQALGFMTRKDEYAQVKPLLLDILAAQDLKFAFEEFVPSGSPPYAAVWICSPQLKKIAYLHIM
jgi:hypothetical protein